MKYRLNSERQRYARWRCQNWPEGSRMPEKVRKICRDKEAEIVHLQELLKGLEDDYETLRAQRSSLYKQHVKDCGRPPSHVCDCGLRL